MAQQPHLPSGVGFDALTELDRIDWSVLRQCYGVGVVGSDLYGDVHRSLALLADDPMTAIGEGLFSNVCHQGTVYEASAYAAPFVAAVAAGDVPTDVRRALTVLFADIAVAGSFIAPGGSWAGSIDDHVAALVTATVRRCDGYLGLIEHADASLTALIAAVRLVITDPSDEHRQAALDLMETVEAQ